MKVNSHNIEFGYELLSAIPYAYELYLSGKLTGTTSGKASEPLYYFSPKHTINPEPRSWYNTPKATGAGIPYTNIHKPNLQPKAFPPYKEHYANDVFKWDKPTLCICNRANVEWMAGVINYFDAEMLDWLFSNLKDQYEIIYFPIGIPKNIQDNAPPEQVFDDIALAEKHGVRVFSTLLTSPERWNAVMLQVFANCEHYITMNGGYSILASYFSGQNIIFSKPGKPQCQEITQGSFWRWYPNINDVQTLHVPSYSELKRKVQALYIDKLPTANVIIRTSNRPKAFRYAMQSVLMQDYQNVNIVVTVDDERSDKYTHGYNCRVIPVSQPQRTHRPSNSKDKPEGKRSFGQWFPANDYIAQAQARVKGYIMFLDDDDKYVRKDAISKVMQQAQKDKLMVWKVQFPNSVIPNGSFGQTPTICDIASIGMCYHSDYIHKSDWTPWKCADYRTAAKWADNEIIWIDQVLTALQSQPGRGMRKDVQQEHQIIIPMKKPIVKVQFIRDFQGRKAGTIEELKWHIAVNFIYREACVEVEDPKEPVKQIQSATGKVMTEATEDNTMVKAKPKPRAKAKPRPRKTKEEKNAPVKTKTDETED
ncbi:MAG: glycosyltransferase family 2 protein [Cryomorphaceae bacterium]|nr:MAG: glycosyltransferase family 2 protein [Cryomorphaceae bacterium]